MHPLLNPRRRSSTPTEIAVRQAQEALERARALSMKASTQMELDNATNAHDRRQCASHTARQAPVQPPGDVVQLVAAPKRDVLLRLEN